MTATAAMTAIVETVRSCKRQQKNAKSPALVILNAHRNPNESSFASNLRDVQFVFFYQCACMFVLCAVYVRSSLCLLCGAASVALHYVFGCGVWLRLVVLVSARL